MKKKLVLVLWALAALLLLSGCQSEQVAGVPAESEVDLVMQFIDSGGDLAYCGSQVSQDSIDRFIQAANEAMADGGNLFSTYGEPVGVYRIKAGEDNTLIASVKTKKGSVEGSRYIAGIVFPE